MRLLNEVMHRRVRAIPLLALAACSPADLVDVDPPSTLVDPAIVTTKTGATQLYAAAIGRLAFAYGGNGFGRDVVHASGFFTDEMMTVTGESASLDLRRPGNSDALFDALHSARTKALQARQALSRYYPDAPKAWFGRLYAAEAYTVLWFAELFCSGMPLSTVPLTGTATPSAGLTTEQLYDRAIALFDSAATLGADSVTIMNLARTGKARALLGQGKFAEAAAAIASVPTDFVYNLEYLSGSINGINRIGEKPSWVQVLDAEGTNGLTWSTDPRAAITTTPALSGAMRVTAKYSRTSSGTLDAPGSYPNTPIRLADGLEARLIEAEADLRAGGSTWLATLNVLRATCIGTAACAPVPGMTASSLPALTDPGTPAARVNMLMRERAMWLFATGHRLGDLRRMVRFYARDPETLYPTGTYNNPGFPPFIAASTFHGQNYGGYSVIPVSPKSEQSEDVRNPLFAGCFNLDS